MQASLLKLESLFAEYNLHSYLGFTQNFLILIDGGGNLLEWNPAFERYTSTQSLAGHHLQDFLDGPSQGLLSAYLASRQPQQTEVRLRAEAGGWDFNCLLTPVRDGNSLVFGEPRILSGEEEITRLNEELVKARRLINIKKVELESVLAQADEISHTDSLTFLANRKRIVADLQREVSACDRHHHPVTVFMADIDHFKQINDHFGHAAGDHVLRVVSAEMLSSIRQIDKLGRYGGEEFMFILPSTTQKASIQIAERLLKIISSKEIRLADGSPIHLTISLGIAQYRSGKESWDGLLKRADQAMYASKHAGRNCWSMAANAKKISGAD